MKRRAEVPIASAPEKKFIPNNWDSKIKVKSVIAGLKKKIVKPQSSEVMQVQ